MLIVLALIAIALLLFAFGYKPNKDSIGAIWTGFVSGGKVLIVTPVQDVGVLIKRVALAVAIVLLLGATLGSPPAPVAPPAVTATEALQAFQSANGLTPDGVLGPKTLAAIQRAYSKKGH